jgi:hypothetical protein
VRRDLDPPALEEIVEVVDEGRLAQPPLDRGASGIPRIVVAQDLLALVARNCVDWKPDEVSRRSRNCANDNGVIVSRMSSWPTRVFMIVRARLSVWIAPNTSPLEKSRPILSSSCSRTRNHSS